MQNFLEYERKEFLAAFVLCGRRDSEGPGKNIDKDITMMIRFITPGGLDTRGLRINKIFINVIRLNPQMCRRVPDNHPPLVSAEIRCFRSSHRCTSCQRFTEVQLPAVRGDTILLQTLCLRQCFLFCNVIIN